MRYEETRWRSRLLAEQALMRERFPGFVLTRAATGTLVWRGVLHPVGDAAFEVSATTPTHYPYAAPELRVERPPLRTGTPHLYANGTLCVHKASWDPMRGTIASVIPLAAAWLVGYLHWANTGEGF